MQNRNEKGVPPQLAPALTFCRDFAADAKTGLTKITWTSITVLPPLIGLCVGAALLTVLTLDLSLHIGIGLLFGVLALAEVGYLCVLILVNRREGALPVASER